MVEFDYTKGVIPTSHGLGPFHPAIRNGDRVMYWPNITKSTEDEAVRYATIALSDALAPTINTVAEWNMFPTP